MGGLSQLRKNNRTTKPVHPNFSTALATVSHLGSATATACLFVYRGCGDRTQQLPHARLQDPGRSAPLGNWGLFWEIFGRILVTIPTHSVPSLSYITPQNIPSLGQEKSHFGRKSGARRPPVIRKNSDRVFQEQFHGD